MLQITPRFINPPKAGKKLSNIKTADNQTFFFDPAKFSFNAGVPYNVETKTHTWGTTIEGIVEQSYAAPQAQAASPHVGGNGSAGAAPVWLPFASNTVAHAIAAGIITAPNMIGPWVIAARTAFEEASK